MFRAEKNDVQMSTLRFADGGTVQQYPLEIPDSIEWQEASGGWTATIGLPRLPAAHAIAPSLWLPREFNCHFRFSLNAGGTRIPLHPVPATGDRPPEKSAGNGSIRTAIDCYHTLRAVDDAVLEAEIFSTSGAAPRPDRYLLTVSIRPDEIEVVAPETVPSVHTPPPPTHSQMLENPRIAGRICSPVATAMAVGVRHPEVDYGRVISECFDPVTGMYGVWPLAIRAASRYGYLGAVELFSDFSPVVRCLERGLPVVASIRYARDALPGAPQRQTAGHLVLVHGLEPEADGRPASVLVNDPAAPDHGSVLRYYPVVAFAEAWFRYRGAAYILTP